MYSAPLPQILLTLLISQFAAGIPHGLNDTPVNIPPTLEGIGRESAVAKLWKGLRGDWAAHGSAFTPLEKRAVKNPKAIPNPKWYGDGGGGYTATTTTTRTTTMRPRTTTRTRTTTTTTITTTTITSRTTQRPSTMTTIKPPVATTAPVTAYSGQATYYYQYGNYGACGNKFGDSALIVAINAPQYGNMGVKSSWCGKQIIITNTANDKTVQATVQDACPGCAYGSLDLSEGAFLAIGLLDTGILPIKWNLVGKSSAVAITTTTTTTVKAPTATTAPSTDVSTPSTDVSAYLANTGITIWTGTNTNQIMSWYQASNSNDNTNGNSWCYFPYLNSSPLVAIPVQAMIANAGGDAMAARKKFCGQEVAITYNGKVTKAYVGDGFDQAWVRTDAALDTMTNLFDQIYGSPVRDKNIVLRVAWQFTGKKSAQYSFAGPGL